MIKLGDLILPDDLVWIDEVSYSPVQGQVKWTIAGKQIFWGQRLLTGRPLTLEAQSDAGWLTKEQVESLYRLASDPQATFELTYHDKKYLVRFRHETPPVIEMRPIAPFRDEYFGTIKLIILEG